MSTTIPYDPSLVLGNIVPKAHLDNLEEISTLQAPVDAALLELNSAIGLKRKLLMTLSELADLGIDTTEVTNAVTTVDSEITTAATAYATVAAKNMPDIAKKRALIPQVSHNIESPIDYNKSQIKKLPISADSLTMDAQYFSFDETTQSSDSTMATMKAFVAGATESMGNKRSAEMTASMQAQVSHQKEVHDIQGTLVITANCTHKNANLFAPFIIDVDKGIRAWNELIVTGKLPDGAQALDNSSDEQNNNMVETAMAEVKADTPYFNLLSGATYGSSFVGMVHVLRESSTQTSQQMYAAAASLQAQMDVGSWYSHKEGGFGINSTFANSAKRLLSSQQISSHISIVVMGVIPTIVANEVQLAVKQFTDFSPDKMMEKLATLQNSTNSEQSSVADAANKARTGAQMMAIRSDEIKSVMSGVGEIEDGKNKILDINSMMTAFTDFVSKAGGGDVGVPIEYFLKPITANQLAQMWVAKYLPGQYITSAGDDAKKKKDDGDKS